MERSHAVEPDQISLRVFVYALNILRATSGLADVQSTIAEALDAEVTAALTDLKLELEEAEELLKSGKLQIMPLETK